MFLKDLRRSGLSVVIGGPFVKEVRKSVLRELPVSTRSSEKQSSEEINAAIADGGRTRSVSKPAADRLRDRPSFEGTGLLWSMGWTRSREPFPQLPLPL